MALAPIKQGYEVFVADGDVAFGTVLRAEPGGDEFVIYVENAGEFRVPATAVKGVHSQKVILNRGKLGQELQQAIRHAHDGEHSDN